MSVLWLPNAGVDPAVIEASQRAVAVIVCSLKDYDYDPLTLYPGADNPAIARNGFALEGPPAVLVEQRLSQEMFELSRGLDLDYSALVSALALAGFLTMRGLVVAAADGSLDSIDPAIAEAVPKRSPPITFAELSADDP